MQRINISDRRVRAPPSLSIGSTLPTSLRSVCSILLYLSVCITADRAGRERLGECFLRTTKGGTDPSITNIYSLMRTFLSRTHISSNPISTRQNRLWVTRCFHPNYTTDSAVVNSKQCHIRSWAWDQYLASLQLQYFIEPLGSMKFPLCIYVVYSISTWQQALIIFLVCTHVCTLYTVYNCVYTFYCCQACSTARTAEDFKLHVSGTYTYRYIFYLVYK